MAESKYLKKVQGNGASTTLSASVSAVATSAPLTADTAFDGEGMLIIDEGTATEEFAYGTAKVGSSITILADDRGLEGGSAQAHDSTATVKGIITAGMWNNLITGVTNVLVNTTGALDTTKVVDLTTSQTLTNKVLTSPTLGGTPVLDATSSIPFYQDSLSRQAIINGAFNVAQRGTTFTAPATAAYTLDRYQVEYSSDAVVDIKQTADSPTVAESGTYTTNCLHADVTTLDASIAAGQLYHVGQLIEGYNIAWAGFGQAGTRYITISFWAKHTKTGTYCVSLRNNAVNRSYVAEYTINVTNTWEKKTITVPVDTSGTWLYTTGIGLKLFFCIAAGSTYQTTANTWAAGNYLATANQVNGLDSASNDFKIAQLQLCAGSVALPFQPKSYEEELRACRRYCHGITTVSTNESVGMGTCASTTVAYIPIATKNTMRTAPTLTATASDWRLADTVGGSVDVTVLAIDDVVFTGTDMAVLKATVAAGLTAGRPAYLCSDTTAGRKLILEAEL